jgi:hypothetical protein
VQEKTDILTRTSTPPGCKLYDRTAHCARGRGGCRPHPRSGPRGARRHRRLVGTAPSSNTSTPTPYVDRLTPPIAVDSSPARASLWPVEDQLLVAPVFAETKPRRLARSGIPSSGSGAGTVLDVVASQLRRPPPRTGPRPRSSKSDLEVANPQARTSDPSAGRCLVESPACLSRPSCGRCRAAESAARPELAAAPQRSCEGVRIVNSGGLAWAAAVAWDRRRKWAWECGSGGRVMPREVHDL